MDINAKSCKVDGLWAYVLALLVVFGCSPETNSNGPGGWVPPLTGGQGGMDAGSPTTTATGAGGSGTGVTSIDVPTGGTEITTSTKLKDDACAGNQIKITRKTPMVLFVIDRSGTTSLTYGNADADAGPVVTRWDALHDAIMDETIGVIKQNQDKMYLGVLLYDGGDLQGAMGGGFMCVLDPTLPQCDAGPKECPRLNFVAPALNNYDAIAAEYNMNVTPPGGLTPTALALQKAYQELKTLVAGGLDKKATFKPVVILVTDGEPNSCDFPPQADYQGPADAVSKAAKDKTNPIKTFVVGIDTSTAGSPAEVQPNLDNLAKLGDTGVDKAFTPTSKQELTDTLKSLIVKSSCDIQLNGEIVKGYEDKGEVILNSEKLTYNDTNGYVVTSPNSITIQGTACDIVGNGSEVEISASFPCEAILLK